MNIVLVSDAWTPQVNGVVTTLRTVSNQLEVLGHSVYVVSPDQFKTIPCPTYPEIRLALNPGKKISDLMASLRPSAVHIATEGPLGIAARSYCIKQRIPFTTSFHTRFPEYIEARTRIPSQWTYPLVRWFHGAASRTMVATDTLVSKLSGRGFSNVVRWSRGVDTDLFHPRSKDFLQFPRPIFLYVGRVSVEKNIKSFLNLNLKGTKLVVGDGPDLRKLKSEYPEVKFVGAKFGEELAHHYAASDVFVFPSKTDTFGLVLLEAMASGIPVAAYPVPGPNDVVGNSGAGILSDNLEQAAVDCLKIDPQICRDHALKFSWEACSKLFLSHLEPIH